MQSITQILASELGQPVQYVENVIALLDEGSTIPFIARYRKEQHGSMDDTTLRKLEDRLQYLRNLDKRRQEVKSAIEGQGKLTEALAAAIDSAATLAEVEDLYRPYTQKRRTRATVAGRRGWSPWRSCCWRRRRTVPRRRQPHRRTSIRRRAWRLWPTRCRAPTTSSRRSSATTRTSARHCGAC